MSNPERYWSNLKSDAIGVLTPYEGFESPHYRCAGPCMAKCEGEPVSTCPGCDGIGMSQPDWHERRAAWEAKEALEHAKRPSPWQRLIARFRRENAEVVQAGHPPIPSADLDPGTKIRVG